MPHFAGKTTRFVVFILLTIIFVSACTSAEPTPEPFVCEDEIGCVTISPENPIKIGSLQVLSGQPAPLGTTQDQTTQLLASERTILDHSIEVVSVDTLCTSEGGANGALRLVTDPQIVGIVGSTCSGAAVGALPIISEKGIVMISGLNTAPSLTSILGVEGEDQQPNYFRVIPNGVAFGATAAAFALNELNITKAASINDGDAYSAGVAQAFRTQFEQLGGEIVADLTVNKGDENMGPLLEALASSDAETVFMPIFQPEADFIVNQSANVEGLENITFMTMESLFVQPFVDSIGDNGVGFYFITAATPDTPEITELRETFEEKFGTPPVHNAYVYAADATNLLLDAIEGVAIQDEDGTLHIGRKALQDALTATENYEGLTGSLSCDEFGDCSGATLIVVQVEEANQDVVDIRENVIQTYTLGQ